MPPKTKITREMILDATFRIVRESGIEKVNARTVAEVLNCSTQPIMYLFDTIEDLKRAVYEKADEYHSEFLMNIENPEEMMLGIGLNYIRFAVKEPNLFKLLFQSGYVQESNIVEMIDSNELMPVVSAMQQESGMSMEQTKKAFILIAIFSHGYASMIASNSLEYNEKVVAEHITRAYQGAILAIKEEN